MMPDFSRIMILTIAASVLYIASAQAAWTLEQKGQAANGAVCYIKSSPAVMNDGYRDIEVHVEYDGSDLVLATPSTIDGSFTDMRAMVDRKKPVISGVALGERNVRYPDVGGALARQARKGMYLSTYARFWPTWPATKAQGARISLKGFTRAHKALATCR